MGTFKLKQRWFYRATAGELERLLTVIERDDRKQGLEWLIMWVNGEDVTVFGNVPTPEEVLLYYENERNWM